MQLLGGSLEVPQKVKCTITYKPAILAENEMKRAVRMKTSTQVFIAALIVMAKKWKQVKCSSTDEWMYKMWSIHTIEYYLAVKRNEV